MTPRRPLLALALVSTMTGCVSAPPAGPIAEYRSGSSAVTGKATCDANYSLVSRDENGPRFGEHQLKKGDRVGFQPEADGSVTATAPGYTVSLPAGTYAWEVVAKTVPSARERWLCDTRRHVVTAFKITGVVLAVAAVAFVVLLVIAIASMDFNYM